VADALEERIASGEFSPGDRLPTERDLAAFYKVSRTGIREALLALEISGLVAIRVSSGAYVLSPAAPEKSLTATSVNDPSPMELLEVRLMLEPEICAAAASNATALHFERISSSINMMRDDHRMDAVTSRGDRAFHLAIAEASGNSIALDVLRNIWDGMDAPLPKTLLTHILSPIFRLKAIADHEAILAAMQYRDRRSVFERSGSRFA
jgi:DNA-binding FadR family transcriptional regulator